MEVEVNKTKLDEASTRSGARSLLYEARINTEHDKDKEHVLKSELKKLFPNTGLAQMASDNVKENLWRQNLEYAKLGLCIKWHLQNPTSKPQQISVLSQDSRL